MTDYPEHLKVYDPNAKPGEVAPEVIAPPRTPSTVQMELMRAIVKVLGNHPELESLLNEFEDLTQAPELPPPSPEGDEHKD
jgi:hypothetical protein